MAQKTPLTAAGPSGTKRKVTNRNSPVIYANEIKRLCIEQNHYYISTSVDFQMTLNSKYCFCYEHINN